MHTVTVDTGIEHVTAEDDRALHAATFGKGMYVLDIGSKFAVTESTTNSLTISDGELVLQGCHARIKHGESETHNFSNGSAGKNRIDLVVAKYKKLSGVESIELVVIEGQVSTGTPVMPSYVTGNILEGAEEVDMPLYKIELTGLSIVITPLFTVATGLYDVYRKNETYTRNEIDTKYTTLNNKVDTLEQDMFHSIENVENYLSDVSDSLDQQIDGVRDECIQLIESLETRVSALERA